MTTKTSDIPKNSYCGCLSKIQLIIVIVVVIIVVSVSISIPTAIHFQNRFKGSESAPEGSEISLTRLPTITTITPSNLPTITTITPSNSPVTSTQSPTMRPTNPPLRQGETFSPTISTQSPSTLSPTTNSPTQSPLTLSPTTNSPTQSPEQSTIQVNWNVNRINGYSPNGFVLAGIDFVLYFVSPESSPQLGTKDGNGNFIYTTVYLGGNFAFVNDDTLAIFLRNPEKYAPRYGGYCAYAMASNTFANGDPNAWTIYSDKLYINLSPSVRNIWDNNINKNIIDADKNWANRGYSN